MPISIEEILEEVRKMEEYTPENRLEAAFAAAVACERRGGKNVEEAVKSSHKVFRKHLGLENDILKRGRET